MTGITMELVQGCHTRGHVTRSLQVPEVFLRWGHWVWVCFFSILLLLLQKENYSLISGSKRMATFILNSC